MRKFYARGRLSILAALTGLIASVGVLNGPTASAALPTPVSGATARSYLSQLTVATENRTGYDRDLFPHWITISGTCNTRETVLKRDGSGVVTDSACASTSGSWYSPYDGATWTAASDLDIDHLVPLAEAWDSGASAWTTAQRQAFANDLTRPQLIAVTDNVNQAKSDQDPATWMPSVTSYRCTYVRAWVQVKYYYDLSVDTAEKSALTSYLASC
ncbi:HNH endonuclease family protein [Streptomyces acidiscabies]|uniref:HNH endonuclease family protein n=1 Tax=Streptomyces acidiscabies TaxID=42234 RepID=A0AAP6B6L7_9ACTN|nr:HNH endonuclease family protein [Streptomyces acidiscabies]MBP5939890.1 HNH endonuclease [Streptomyces sp. LBUM 1476]MBZ3911075.1 HNH endonuclease [Streptomyces acidiscabies]MDX2959143.1 HNH endonuclease family protein [Streptomyces acidiscabies]MDX3025733.1 HNH endonuclease family protein [Streptomyces acidiscabies]MDX3788188.1 HNH endonuclease family protein [Streptomyces acidiscabies]